MVYSTGVSGNVHGRRYYQRRRARTNFVASSISLYLPSPVHERLAAVAEDRRLSLSQFISRLVEVVVSDDLVDAVFDDTRTFDDS